MRSVCACLLSGLAALICLTLSGCAPHKPKTDPALDKKALGIATAARGLNREIQTSKGTGWLHLESGDRNEKYRIFWAAHLPNRLRITFTASGMPVETIAATGERVTFVSHTGRHAPHTAVSNDPDLAKYMDVPVRLSDMVSLLLGRIPLMEFDTAWFSPDIPGHSQISLTQNFKSGSQELVLDKERRVQSLKFRDRKGELRYEIRFQSWQDAGPYRIPRELSLSDGRFRSVFLSISRFLPNPPLKESVFMLTPSGS